MLRVIDASKGDTVVIYLPMGPEATIDDPNILPDISQALTALGYPKKSSVGTDPHVKPPGCARYRHESRMAELFRDAFTASIR